MGGGGNEGSRLGIQVSGRNKKKWEKREKKGS